MFGKLLRIARKAAGIGVRQFAREMDLSPSYVSRMEHGETAAFKDDDLEKAEKILGLPPESLKAATKRIDYRHQLLLEESAEIGDFLLCAQDEGLDAADFMALTALLKQEGKQGLRRLLKKNLPQANKGAERKSADFYVADCLEKDCIFDIRTKQISEKLLSEMATWVKGRRKVNLRNLKFQLRRHLEDADDDLGRGIRLSHIIIENGGFPQLLLVRQQVNKGKLWFLIITGQEERKTSLNLLGRTARLCAHNYVRKRLLAESTKEDVLELFRQTVTSVPSFLQE